MEQLANTPNAALNIEAAGRWPMLAFHSPTREQDYQDWALARMRSRTQIALAIASLSFVAFGLKDWWLLPAWLAQMTMTVQCFWIAPALAVTALLLQRGSPEQFRLVVALGWVLAVVPLIGLLLYSQARGQLLPYEGLLLAVLFLFFLAGLNPRSALTLTILSNAGYLLGMAWLDMEGGLLAMQFFYLSTATIMGFAGAVMYEDLHRRMYITGASLANRADTDGLTGLPNRRSLERAYTEIWRLAARQQRPLSVIYLDLDFFKQLNDELGHEAGDRVLCSVAHVLAGNARRPLDTVARLGGEEFMVLAYDLDERATEHLAEKLRQAVFMEHIAHPKSRLGPWVTVSVGAAHYFPEQRRADFRLWAAADMALQDAKQAGRNRSLFRPTTDLTPFQENRSYGHRHR